MMPIHKGHIAAERSEASTYATGCTSPVIGTQFQQEKILTLWRSRLACGD